VSGFDDGGSGSRPRGPDPVGSVGEEAAKLLAALQGWTREHLGDDPADHGAHAGPAAQGGTPGGGGFASGYIADGSAACRVCPVCQLIALARGVNPESLEQLSRAAGTMLHALADLVDSAGRSHARRGAPVQKIDLTDDSEDSTWR
jgi:hypothetical protein